MPSKSFCTNASAREDARSGPPAEPCSSTDCLHLSTAENRKAGSDSNRAKPHGTQPEAAAHLLVSLLEGELDLCQPLVQCWMQPPTTQAARLLQHRAKDRMKIASFTGRLLQPASASSGPTSCKGSQNVHPPTLMRRSVPCFQTGRAADAVLHQEGNKGIDPFVITPTAALVKLCRQRHRGYANCKCLSQQYV